MKTLLLTILFISSWNAITAQMLTIEPSTFVMETVGTIQACVTYPTGQPTTETTVSLSTRDASAVSMPAADADYTAIMETLVFSQTTQSKQCVEISIHSDSRYEGFEYFDVIIATPFEATVSVVIQSTGRITVGFNQPSYTFNEDEGGMVCVVILQGRIQGAAITVQLTLNGTDGSATEADDDYNRASFVTIFLTEDTPATGVCISSGILPDNDVESDEFFTLGILAPDMNTNISSLSGQAQIVITNDDAACPSPPVQMDGSFTLSSPQSSGTSAAGVTATYSCSLGFTLDGPDTLTCQLGDVWSPTAPGTCQPIDCGSLPPPDNGMVDFQATIVFSKATYSCNNGYVLMGIVIRTCSLEGTWTDNAPTCEPRDCGSLTPPDNGTVDHVTTTFPSVATYSCSTEFILEGDSTRTCQADGSWSNSEPTCRAAVQCPNLEGIFNGQVSVQSTSERNIATYFCNDGFILMGDSTRTCQADGSWSNSEPTCRAEAQCPDLENIANGRVSAPRTSEGSIATYSCDSEFPLLSGGTRTCQQDGNWSGFVPICTRIIIDGVLTEEEKQNIGIGVGVSLAGLMIIIPVVVAIAVTVWCVVKKRGSDKYVLNYTVKSNVSF